MELAGGGPPGRRQCSLFGHESQLVAREGDGPVGAWRGSPWKELDRVCAVRTAAWICPILPQRTTVSAAPLLPFVRPYARFLAERDRGAPLTASLAPDGRATLARGAPVARDPTQGRRRSARSRRLDRWPLSARARDGGPSVNGSVRPVPRSRGARPLARGTIVASAAQSFDPGAARCRLGGSRRPPGLSPSAGVGRPRAGAPRAKSRTDDTPSGVSGPRCGRRASRWVEHAPAGGFAPAPTDRCRTGASAWCWAPVP